MLDIDADLSILARIKKDGKTYELHELEFQHLKKLRAVDLKDNKAVEAAMMEVLDASGFPKEVAEKCPMRVLKQLEKIIVGEYNTKKK